MDTPSSSERTPLIAASDPGAVREHFRAVLSRFGSGVVVVTTTETDGTPVGMTVGSFTSISLDPPLVGFFAAHTSTTLPRVLARDTFCVNVLAETQHGLARAFARSGADKFAGVDWIPGIDGAPRLTGAHAWIDCRLDHSRPIGDHDLIVGAVDALVAPDDSEPLLFHRSAFHGLREAR